MRTRRRWVENLAMWGVGMLVMFTAFPAAILVHENASQWELPAIFISLGLGLAPAAWYVRAKRSGWLVGTLSAVLLGFSFTSAVLHGWKAPVLALINIGALILVAVVLVSLYRMGRRADAARRALVEELKREALVHGEVLFRDDGERITVYPSRRRLVLQCAFQALFLAILGGVFVFIRIGSILALGAVGLFTGLLAATFLAILYRLMVRRPTLVVSPDGIFDNGSLIATGTGLLHWDEILDVEEWSTSSGAAANRYLGILVADTRAVRRRQPLLKQVALRLIVWWPPSQFSIWQGILSVPATELAGQIEHYVATHAPAGWRDDDDEDDAASATGL